LFLSMPDEIDATTAIHAAWGLGKTVVVPKVDWEHRTMVPVVLSSFDHLEVDRGSLRNPPGDQVMDVGWIDLVVTPGLGFDRQGRRLGRGAGFYDRFFADPRLRAGRCGLCYADQIVDVIPVSGTDLPVDWLVTDEQVFYIQDRKGI
jgi:5-formyltetrahydrofolate cyclo-ligase